MKAKRGLLSGIAAVAAAAALMLPATALAAGGPPSGRGGGGGGGGGGEETTASNNLSVPTLFVGAAGFGLTNPALQPPTGDPGSGYEINPTAYYYVQGQNKWQAQYQVVEAATATAAWGDNLAGGSASIKAGHPVRVEVGLTSDVSMQGYEVVKLQPSLEDRNSAYGTLATGDATAGFSATAVDMPARVWASGAQLAITGPDGITTTADMPGEINATGAVVFGYNWWPAETGSYTLTFLVPSGITVAGGNPSIDVVVGGGGGGGGGGSHGGGGNVSGAGSHAHR